MVNLPKCPTIQHSFSGFNSAVPSCVHHNRYHNFQLDSLLSFSDSFLIILLSHTLTTTSKVSNTTTTTTIVNVIFIIIVIVVLCRLSSSFHLWKGGRNIPFMFWNVRRPTTTQLTQCESIARPTRTLIFNDFSWMLVTEVIPFLKFNYFSFSLFSPHFSLISTFYLDFNVRRIHFIVYSR